MELTEVNGDVHTDDSPNRSGPHSMCVNGRFSTIDSGFTQLYSPLLVENKKTPGKENQTSNKSNGRPFVKRLALCHGTVVCPVCLSVCLSVCNVGVSRPNGWNGGWIKLPLVTEVGICPGDTVLDGDPAPRKGVHQPPTFPNCLLWRNSRPSQQPLSFCTLQRRKAQAEFVLTQRTFVYPPT